MENLSYASSRLAAFARHGRNPRRTWLLFRNAFFVSGESITMLRDNFRCWNQLSHLFRSFRVWRRSWPAERYGRILYDQGVRHARKTLCALVLRHVRTVSVLWQHAKSLRLLSSLRTEAFQRIVGEPYLRYCRNMVILRNWSVGVQLAQSSRPRSQRIFDIAISIRKALNRANLKETTVSCFSLPKFIPVGSCALEIKYSFVASLMYSSFSLVFYWHGIFTQNHLLSLFSSKIDPIQSNFKNTIRIIPLLVFFFGVAALPIALSEINECFYFADSAKFCRI